MLRVVYLSTILLSIAFCQNLQTLIEKGNRLTEKNLANAQRLSAAADKLEMDAQNSYQQLLIEAATAENEAAFMIQMVQSPAEKQIGILTKLQVTREKMEFKRIVDDITRLNKSLKRHIQSMSQDAGRDLNRQINAVMRANNPGPLGFLG